VPSGSKKPTTSVYSKFEGREWGFVTSTDIAKVQIAGIASGVTLPTSGVVQYEQGAVSSAFTGVMCLAEYGTDNEARPLQVDNANHLKVGIQGVPDFKLVGTTGTHWLGPWVGVDIKNTPDIRVFKVAASNLTPLNVKGNIGLLASASNIGIVGVKAGSSDMGTVHAKMATHDNLNCNANVQFSNVDVTGGNPLPITGTVTINGTPLAVTGTVTVTSAVLDDIRTSLQIIDDWDNSNRADVRIADVSASVPISNTTLTTIQSTLSTILDSIQVLEGWDSSTRARVDIQAAAVTSLNYLDRTWTFDTDNVTGTSTQELMDAVGASKYNYIKKIFIVNNDNANLEIAIQEGDGTTLIANILLPAFGGQFEMDFPGGGIKQPSANTCIEVTHIAGATPDYTWFVEYATGT